MLFRLYPSADVRKELDQSMIGFSFSNIAAETLENSCIFYESLLSVQPHEYILIIGNIRLAEVRIPLCEMLQALFSNVKKIMNIDISCCISPEVPMTELPKAIIQLRTIQENNLSVLNTPLFLSEYVPRQAAYVPPSLDVIGTFLEEKQSSAAVQNLENYLKRLSDRKEIHKDLLKHLQIDMEQLIFSYLRKNGIDLFS